MQVIVEQGRLEDCFAEALIIFYSTPDESAILQINAALEGGISKLVDERIFAPQLGQVMILPTFGRTAALHVVVLGWGDAKPATTDATSAIVMGIRKAYDWAADDMAIVLPPYFTADEGVGIIRSVATQADQFLSSLKVCVPTAALADELNTLLT